jgi:hypothetical protein
LRIDQTSKTPAHNKNSEKTNSMTDPFRVEGCGNRVPHVVVSEERAQDGGQGQSNFPDPWPPSRNLMITASRKNNSAFKAGKASNRAG